MAVETENIFRSDRMMWTGLDYELFGGSIFLWSYNIFYYDNA